MSSKVQLQRQQRHLWAAVSNVGFDAGEFPKSCTYIYIYTSSTARGGGGSFKNRKRIGDWLL